MAKIQKQTATTTAPKSKKKPTVAPKSKKPTVAPKSKKSTKSEVEALDKQVQNSIVKEQEAIDTL